MELLIPLSLIVLGLVLIVVEVYVVPGFNVVGLFGFLSIIFGIGYTFTTHGLTGGIVATIGTLGVGAALFYVLWRSGAWNRFVLTTSLGPDRTLTESSEQTRSRYLGRSGVAVTPLRPAGVALIDGERLEVATEGEFIAAGSRVRVVAMDRRRFFVRLDD